MSLPQKIYVIDHHRLSSELGVSFPRSAFAGATLDHLFTGDRIDSLPSPERERVLAFNQDFLDCDCESKPYCGHPEEKCCRWILEARLEGRSPGGIIDAMGDAYHLYTYEADLVAFLDDSIRRLEALSDLANVESQASYADRVDAVTEALERGTQPSR